MDFINAFFEMVSALFIQIGNMLSGIVTLITVSIASITIPQTLFLWVPGIIGTSITVVAAIGLVKLILSWGNQ